ncbi:MAG TPA: zinc ribbon domain-containing protein [Candidatus Bathyarchaeia archaeon]|nr:zinc ribbon domain-containing protein [Candidatus Bathyarchaeia archaeon]
MVDEKLCEKCGAKNQPYAAFCAECGESFIAPAAATPPPPEEPSPDQEWGAYEGKPSAPAQAPPEKPRRRFAKRYFLYALIVLLLLAIVAGAAVSMSHQSASTTTASPTIQASAAATAMPHPSASAGITNTSSASATPQPAASIAPNFASKLNTAGIGAGFTAVSPFAGITAYGRQAYAGTLVQNGNLYNAQVFPMNSYSEALAFRDQLVTTYEARGYAPYTPGTQLNSSPNLWYGLSGQTLVGVSAMPTSQAGVPITLVITTTVHA